MASSFEILIFVLGTLVPFSLVGFIFYLYFKARTKERLRLIEKGLDPSFNITKGSGNPDFSAFRYGLLFTGVGLGIFIGFLLSALSPFNNMAAYLSMILIFGGGSLILSYFLEKKKLDSIKDEES